MKRTEFAALVAEILTAEQVAQIEQLHDELDSADGCAAHGEGVFCCVAAIGALDALLALGTEPSAAVQQACEIAISRDRWSGLPVHSEFGPAV